MPSSSWDGPDGWVCNKSGKMDVVLTCPLDDSLSSYLDKKEGDEPLGHDTCFMVKRNYSLDLEVKF